VAGRRVAGERHSGDLAGVDQNVEAVRECDALAGGNEGLSFDWFVAVAGMQDGGTQAGLVQNVVGQAGG